MIEPVDRQDAPGRGTVNGIKGVLKKISHEKPKQEEREQSTPHQSCLKDIDVSRTAKQHAFATEVRNGRDKGIPHAQLKDRAPTIPLTSTVAGGCHDGCTLSKPHSLENIWRLPLWVSGCPFLVSSSKSRYLHRCPSLSFLSCSRVAIHIPCRGKRDDSWRVEATTRSASFWSASTVAIGRTAFGSPFRK